MNRLVDRLKPGRQTIRARIALLSLVSVAVALVAFSVALVLVQRALLTDRIEEGIETRARDIGALVRSGESLSGIEQTGEDAFFQVIAEDGSVIRASSNVSGQPAFTGASVPLGQLSFVDASGPVEGDFDTFRVAVLGVDSNGETTTVLVGRNLEPVTDATETLTLVLTISVPLLVLLVGISAWFLTGAALKPVDRMRSAVDQIGGEIKGRRVEEPGTRDEIERLAATMNRMLDRVDQVQQSQKRFVADASHELRTPLTAFRAGLEASIEAAKDDQTAELLGATLADVDRMELLIEELLEEAVEAARDEQSGPQSVRVDLDDLVLEEAAAVRATAAVTIDTSAVSAAQVSGVASQLRRVVRNLLNNAASNAEHNMTVSLREADGTARLAIENDGPEIPASEHERIFEPFVQLDSSRARRKSGAGLGLTITRRIVESHRGRVHVDPDFTGGARFVIVLPTA